MQCIDLTCLWTLNLYLSQLLLPSQLILVLFQDRGGDTYVFANQKSLSRWNSLYLLINKLTWCARKLKEMNSQDSLARAVAKIFKLYFISSKLLAYLKPLNSNSFPVKIYCALLYIVCWNTWYSSVFKVIVNFYRFLNFDL